MLLKFKNDAGTEIDVESETIQSVEDVGCDEHCVLHLGSSPATIPLRVEGNVKGVVKAFKQATGRKLAVIPLAAAGTDKPEEAGLPAPDGDGVPPPSEPEGAEPGDTSGHHSGW